ncbi:putative ubiquitin carboxyl-terminal hydrolase 8 [Cucumispora dikerogammari]|nr:putative ubiquitin carboxyl-terminal hydrolase 8 [Cucumispora dikerogammari]
MPKKQETLCEHFLLIENLEALIEDGMDIAKRFNSEEDFTSSKISKRVLCLECKFLKEKKNIKSHECVAQIFLDLRKNLIICGKCFCSAESIYFTQNRYIAENIEIQPRGFQNLGNTCFMNAVLQIFFTNKHFLNTMIHHTQCETSNCIYCAIKHILNTSKQDSTLIPKRFWNSFTFRNKTYQNSEQHDSQEFFNSLCNSLHDCSFFSKKIVHSKCYCVSHHLFGGTFSIKLKCTSCRKNVVCRIEPFFEISLAVNDTDVFKMLLNFLKEETLNTNEGCRRCNTTKGVNKITEIYEYPKILTLHIKLFTFNSKRLSKLSNNLTFSTNIQFNDKIKYSLIGTVNHTGSLNWGHYTSYTLIKGKWFFCNDICISEVEEQTVLKSTPYLLFYELNG